MNAPDFSDGEGDPDVGIGFVCFRHVGLDENSQVGGLAFAGGQHDFQSAVFLRLAGPAEEFAAFDAEHANVVRHGDGKMSWQFRER